VNRKISTRRRRWIEIHYFHPESYEIKYPDNPVNPVKKLIFKIASIPYLFLIMKGMLP